MLGTYIGELLKQHLPVEAGLKFREHSELVSLRYTWMGVFWIEESRNTTGSNFRLWRQSTVIPNLIRQEEVIVLVDSLCIVVQASSRARNCPPATKVGQLLDFL
jgi:hypothetical protein